MVRPGEFVQVEVEIPKPYPGEVILQMQAVTVCGSDVRIFTGEKTGGVVWPAVIGHEFNGRVVDVGDRVSDEIEIGQLYAVVPWVGCGKCSACRGGNCNFCDQLRVFGYQIHGGLSEYVRIPREAVEGGNLVRLPDSIDPVVAALSEPLACVLNGHLRCSITPGDSVLVLGAGPIGMLHTKLALLAGASVVVVSEPNSERAQEILRAGATHIVDPLKEDPVERVREITGDHGVDVAIICIGIASLVDVATKATKANGVINLFAGFAGSGEGQVNLNVPHYKQQTLLGNAGATVELYRRASALIATGAIDVSDMVSKRFPLSQAEEALQAAMSGRYTKVAIVPDSAMQG